MRSNVRCVLILSFVANAALAAPACVDDPTPVQSNPDATYAFDASGADAGGRTDAPDSVDTGVALDAPVDTDVDAEPSCTTPTKGPTTHVTVNGDETWTADGSPHIVTFDLGVAAGKTLTLEPCVEVLVDDHRGITVTGKLVANGTAKRPIRIANKNAGQKWGTLSSLGAQSELHLSYVTLEHGGYISNSVPDLMSMILVRSDQYLPPQPTFFADHVTVANSDTIGIRLTESGGFAPGSTALTVTGSTSFPIRAYPRLAGSIPDGSYTGNGVDAILLSSGVGGDVFEDMTLRDRGVPYRVGTPTSDRDLRVVKPLGDAGVPVLTIEPGVTIAFHRDSSPDGGPGTAPAAFEIGAGGAAPTGAIHAVGTALKPIKFTSASATPAAGDWIGLYFSHFDPRSVIDYAIVEYTGAASGAFGFSCNTAGGERGGILILGAQPPSEFITNTTISNTLGDGIGRGWTGDLVDFVSAGNNTFVNVAQCKQSYPRPSVGPCPALPPCP